MKGLAICQAYGITTENYGYVNYGNLFINSIKNENVKPAWVGTCVTLASTNPWAGLTSAQVRRYDPSTGLNESKEGGCRQALTADLGPGPGDPHLLSPLHPPHQQERL